MLATLLLTLQLASAAVPQVREGTSMGTDYRLEVVSCRPAAEVQRALDGAAAALQRVDRLMTTWEHPGWPRSDVMRLQDAAGGDWVNIEAATLTVLQAARRLSALSDGAFDVTVGALSELWQVDAALRPRVPAPRLLAARLPLVNWRALQLDAAGNRARLTQRGMRLTLGGIAKGYAVDRAAAALRAAGLDTFLVQAGGDLLAAGRPHGTPWRVGIRDPGAGDGGRPLAVLPLTAGACSTAGDYERGFWFRGRRYHHILDPRTGMPTATWRSVTVLAHSAMWADALGDALMVLGPQRGRALLQRLPEVQAFGVPATGGWEALHAEEGDRLQASERRL